MLKVVFFVFSGREYAESVFSGREYAESGLFCI